MKRRDDQEKILKLKHDWEQVDKLGGNSSISVLEIKNQLKVHEAKQAKKFYKELTLFLFTAVCILSAIIMSFVQSPVLFIAIQIGSIFFAPLVLFVLLKRSKQEGMFSK
ncbi:hypothetical protein BKP45_13340 [Anaerobacillus alkalidiazotrophicus]|uniref:YxlC family protein n=1 Tax=Anaerobacillus alkalidiazotrophicus TaxID=472963 RepID=A0A1S2M482_9BACI|nr:YxlC family protein [Anaerobacillus alkalidiazotrophicus]OIJ19424.1 hypothetical protein BKP45_13340 [Anaerobacillus alkalidiazotrophicus]